MKNNIKLRSTCVVTSVILLAVAAPLFAEPTTQPTTQPMVAQVPATQPSVASVLADVDAAYGKLRSLKLDGHIVGHFDVQGQKGQQDVAFTSAFQAPNKFRHDASGDILLGSTGSNVFTFLGKRDEYQTADAPKDRAASADWPSSTVQILAEQNPSLLLAICKSAAAELRELSPNVTLQAPTVIDSISYPTLQFEIPGDHRVITMLIDPATNLLHQARYDLREALKKAGAVDVKQAEVTVDYTHIEPNAAVDSALFAWTAPAGAVLQTAAATVMDTGDDGLSEGLKAMVGKPAPDFTLKGLDDKSVKLSDSKGSVVVLDMWATWCGPCVESLPHLDKLYTDESPKGLKVFAVNLQEAKEQVQGFVKQKGWTLPVLLDSDGAVAAQYKAEAIPETVVIGKDGNIKKIFVGGGQEGGIAALVAKEMQ